MFTNFPFTLFEVVIAVAAIMALDHFLKSWRGWRYYGLAFIAALAGVWSVVMLALLLTHGDR